MRFFVIALLFISLNTHAAESKEQAKQNEMMAKFMEAATPQAPHKMLSNLAGEYTFTSKSWPAAGAKAMEGKGDASFKMLLGGRWLQYSTKTEAAAGMPAYEGYGMIGFDNVTKKHQSIWMDTMSTGLMKAEGTFDEKTKTLSDSGRYSCPVTGKESSYRTQWLLKDKNNMVFSLFGASPFDSSGKEFKMMEIAFKRK